MLKIYIQNRKNCSLLRERERGGGGGGGGGVGIFGFADMVIFFYPLFRRLLWFAFCLFCALQVFSF